MPTPSRIGERLQSLPVRMTIPFHVPRHIMHLSNPPLQSVPASRAFQRRYIEFMAAYALTESLRLWRATGHARAAACHVEGGPCRIEIDPPGM